MSAITTHVLDLKLGKPGAGIAVALERESDTAQWEALGNAVTDLNGRATDLLSADNVFVPGHYRLIFETGDFFASSGGDVFFPQVTITFVVRDTSQHYHVPLLLSPYGYSTYRGS